MGAQLKIDSDEAYGLATELAGLRGESIESVVTLALQEALERARKAHVDEEPYRRRADERIKRLEAIMADIHRELPHPLPFIGHDWLYDDETGLPK